MAACGTIALRTSAARRRAALSVQARSRYRRRAWVGPSPQALRSRPWRAFRPSPGWGGHSLTCSHTTSSFLHRLAAALAGGSLAVAVLVAPGCGGDRPALKPTATVAPKAATDDKV